MQIYANEGRGQGQEKDFGSLGIFIPKKPGFLTPFLCQKHHFFTQIFVFFKGIFLKKVGFFNTNFVQKI